MKLTSQTRLSILQILREKGIATATELSQMLEITLSGIRQQLSLLEREELIEVKRKTGQPGRPLHSYSLTNKSEQYFFKNYASLSLELIDQMVEDHGKKWLKNFLKNRTKKLIEKHIKRQIQAKNLKNKFEIIAKVQDEAGYMAHADYEKGLPVLKEYNCPFIDVAKKYPEFCEAERKAYQEILGRPVKLNGCRAQGANLCKFCLSEKE